jgi:Fe-S cluster assembly ATPase SufC
MRPTLALLLVLGIVLGPVYYAYCLLFTGETTQHIKLTERANRWVTVDGSILRYANGLAYKPVALQLAPHMNRVSLRLQLSLPEQHTRTAAAELRYQASLLQLEHTVMQRPVTVKISAGQSREVDIGPLEIPYPAEYLFVLEEIGTPVQIPTLSLELMEKIEVPSRPVVWSGMALLMLAAIISLRDMLAALRKQTPY